LSALGRAAPLACHNHIDFAAAAFGADQPLTPIGHRHFGTVPSSHLGGIGLDLMLAFSAPNDQPDAGGGSVAERHRWAGFGLHLQLCLRSFWQTTTYLEEVLVKGRTPQ
jgi:hypothetical protein